MFYGVVVIIVDGVYYVFWMYVVGFGLCLVVGNVLLQVCQLYFKKFIYIVIENQQKFELFQQWQSVVFCLCQDMEVKFEQIDVLVNVIGVVIKVDFWFSGFGNFLIGCVGSGDLIGGYGFIDFIMNLIVWQWIL